MLNVIKDWAELIYYVAFILLTALIVYYAKRTYVLESSRHYELLCDLVIQKDFSAGHVLGYALEIYNAGNKTAKNVSVSIEGKDITVINFIKPGSSFYYPIGKLFQTLGGNTDFGTERIHIEQGKPVNVSLCADNKKTLFQINTDILFVTRNTDTGSLKGIEERLEKIEKAVNKKR